MGCKADAAKNQLLNDVRYIFYGLLCVWCVMLTAMDRYFFKGNDSFSIRFLYSSMPNRVEWDLPVLTSYQSQLLDEILSQKFTYFAKGTHCYAFVSEDQKYVIKFHRYPSHMRLFPWLNHPLSYHFDQKRKAIKAYNLTRYAYFMNNYKMSYLDLKEEAGLILVHINRTENLNKIINLIDKTGNRYSVSLDDVTFILQQKADLIYPSMAEAEKAKNAISHILELIVQCCRKGYINNDPVLYRNYGLLADRAIHIDIGDLVKREEITESINYMSHLREVTYPLREWILQNNPALLTHYEAEMQRLLELQ